MPENNKPVPAWLERKRNAWRRFELTSEDIAQIALMEAILERHNLSRFELAVIVATLRVRPEFSFADFDI